MRRVLTAVLAATIAGTAYAKPYSFVAFGDTAYKLPRDTGRLDRLIDAINAESPAFAIHVGDFKGYTSCSDESYRAVISQYRRLKAALVITPGDNDWFDCSVDTAGEFDPLERMAVLRSLMFTGPSAGGERMPLQRQKAFPENARWLREGVTFATVHVIGPHNGFVRDARLMADAIARSKAGETWVREAFATARAAKSPAIVLAFQADPWWATAPNYENGPFDWLRNLIGEEARTFPGQVLIINGDSHRLIIDNPYRRADSDAGTTSGLNVTRLMVPGWPDHRAVLIEVEPERPSVFRFSIVMQPEETAGAKP